MLNQIVADSGTATESRSLRFGITPTEARRAICRWSGISPKPARSPAMVSRRQPRQRRAISNSCKPANTTCRKAKKIAAVRADSAAYQATIFNWWEETGKVFAIGADQDTAVKAAIKAIPEDPMGRRIRAAATQSTPTARRTEDRRWPRAARSSEGADQPGTRSARTAAWTDQGGGSRAGRAVRCGEGGGANASAGDDVARDQRHRSGIRRHPLDGGVFSQLRQSKTGRGLRGVAAHALAKRIGRSRAGRFQSRKSAIADNAKPRSFTAKTGVAKKSTRTSNLTSSDTAFGPGG